VADNHPCPDHSPEKRRKGEEKENKKRIKGEEKKRKSRGRGGREDWYK
jgi:hypothetical protein